MIAATAVAQSTVGHVETIPPTAAMMAPIPASVVFLLLNANLPFDSDDPFAMPRELAPKLEQLAVHLVELYHHAHRRSDDGGDDGDECGEVVQLHDYSVIT